MPSLESIGAGRQTFEIESAVFAAQCVIWMFEHRNVTVHPGMHVALDWNCDLFSRECLLHRSTRRLSLVPFAIVSRLRMDVVHRLVFVLHIKFLMSLHRDHVRC